MTAMDNARRERQNAGDAGYDSDKAAAEEDKALMDLCGLVRVLHIHCAYIHLC
jgi:hypothetical protein